MTTVVAAVLQSGGRVLVCQRKPEQVHALKWEFPGGKVEPGEEPVAALRRELEEELGITAEIGPEITRYEFAYPGKPPIQLIFFSVRHFTGTMQNKVFRDIAWTEFRKLPEFDFLAGDVAFVQDLLGVTAGE